VKTENYRAWSSYVWVTWIFQM